ncbi:MAG: hypothetical protein HY721_04480 [Planctomycetes bacterium]|nr:hypothetical protein [Planctomycetota bacterium]
MSRILSLLVFLAGLAAAFSCALLRREDSGDTTQEQVADVAHLELPVFEDTKRARNEKLREVFEDYLRRQGRTVSAATVTAFHRILKDHGLTTFEDFLAAETTPLHHVRDPDSGDEVPVFGALGSDVINPWLGALEVVEGNPLEEQPLYALASNALREHIDFALIGVKDPNLSLDLLPPKLRENAELAYCRLNPTGRFDGGFDHPLFYATVREAAKKLFREDYPRAKPSMADLVVPEERGGFGIRSCLLCHDRSHRGVYKRLLGQGLYLEAKAAGLPEGSDDARRAKESAAVFLRAAGEVLDAFPGKIDAEAVRRSLVLVSGDDLERLKPGFDDLAGALRRLGCTKCHSTDNTQSEDKNPVVHEAWALHPSNYYKTENIKMLAALIDFSDLDQSKLLRKVAAESEHEGADELKLPPEDVARELRSALDRWLYSFRG